MIFHAQAFDDLVRSVLGILYTFIMALNQTKFEVTKRAHKTLLEVSEMEKINIIYQVISSVNISFEENLYFDLLSHQSV